MILSKSILEHTCEAGGGQQRLCLFRMATRSETTPAVVAGAVETEGRPDPLYRMLTAESGWQDDVVEEAIGGHPSYTTLMIEPCSSQAAMTRLACWLNRRR